jgi:hypothetical protein
LLTALFAVPQETPQRPKLNAICCVSVKKLFWRIVASRYQKQSGALAPLFVSLRNLSDVAQNVAQDDFQMKKGLSVSA